MKHLWRIGKSLCCFILFLAVVLFAQPMFSRLAGLYLQRKCLEAFATDLQGGNSYWKEGVFYVENLHLASEKSIDEGGYQLFAPRLEARFALSFWTREIAVSLFFEKPIVRVGPEKLLESWSTKAQEKSYFSINPLVSVEEGLFIYSGSDAIPFALELSLGDRPLGHIDFHFHHAKHKDGHLAVTLRDNTTPSFDLTFEDVDMALVTDAMRFFALSSDPFAISKGLASGSLHVNMEEKAPFSAQGAFVATDMIAAHTKFDLEVFSPKMSFDVSYHHAARRLDFDKINGEMHCAKAGLPFALRNAAVHLLDLNDKSCEFDLCVDYGGVELFSAVGKTVLNDERIEFHFHNPVSHLFGVSPAFLDLSLDASFHVDRFALSLSFELDRIKTALSQLVGVEAFAATGLNASHVKALQAAHGCFDLALEYDQDQFRYHLNGSKCRFNGTPFEKCIVQGRKIGPLWAIDHCSLDELSLTADLSHAPGKWLVNFLGVRFSNGLLAAVEGEYQVDKKLFEGRVTVLEADLQHFKGLGLPEGVWEQFPLSGHLKASGHFSMQLLNGDPGCKMEAFLTSTIASPRIMGLSCSDIGEFACHWISGEKIGFKAFKTCFNSNQKEEKASISFSEIDWDLQTNQFRIDDLQFAMPPQQAAMIVSKLHDLSPQHIDVDAAACVLRAKKDGLLKGKLHWKDSPNGDLLRLELAKGSYMWQESEYQISNFALEHTQAGLHAVFNSTYQGLPFWCLLHSNTSMSHGQIFFSEHFPRHSPLLRDPEIVRVDWHKSALSGLLIDKIEGRFSGLDLNLSSDPISVPSPDAISLVGKVSFDLPRAKKWLTAEAQEGLLKWGVRGRYLLNGRWNYKRALSDSSLSRLSFQAGLQGQNIECNGYRFASLEAQIEHDLNSTTITKGIIEDAAGRLQIDKLTLTPSEYGTLLAADKVLIKNLRPAFLCHLDATPPLTGTACVMQIEMQNLLGYPYDMGSFTGSGKLNFKNRSKKSLLHALFVIPSEILHRIGLNLTILTPASGTLFFNVQEGKFFLTRLKDVYSKGRFSKFYIDTRLYHSYIDFNGNLDLQVRMRQYNLLFKLAELFTVNVSGSLHQPIYSLKKQMRKRE